METGKITKEQLRELLETGQDVLVLDLMNPEFYAEKHIAGAANAPIYEVNFPEYVTKLTEDKNRRIVIYDDNTKPYAREDAVAKLANLGFKKIEIFEGGLREWQAAGYPVASGAEVPLLLASDGEHSLDVEKSLIGWIGRNAKYAHHGKIALKGGQVTFKNGQLLSGEIVLDMTTIQNEDLIDPLWRGVLETHLKSSDFFNVEKYPEARFVFRQANPILNTPYGTPNYVLKGELTIKDVTRPFEFPAMVVPQEDGSINGQAHFDLDRTLWNVRYGSEKFFEKLGMHLVNDVVSLEIFLVAKP